MELADFRKPMIIAHRGYSAKYPENTLSAFRAALDAGAQMIELDVTLTRDRNVVVIHDDTLDRTTNGKGAVNGYSLTELKGLDTGSWFDPKFAAERIPSLEEVLEKICCRAFINVEIKSNAYETHNPPDAIERQVVEMIRRKKVRGQVLVSSFEPKILENIATMNAAPAVALLSTRSADRKAVELCKRLKAFSWHPDCHQLDPQQVAMMHAANINVFPYNVKTLAEIEMLIQMEVDGVIIGDPLMNRHGISNVVEKECASFD
jgi:glycerophosphoryl diester phosphodiesterase